MQRSFRLFALVVLFGISRGHFDTALAQSISSASIEGTVADETKAPLPGVSVTITSPALQVGKKDAVTDATGHYRFVDLPIGTYVVLCELSGFRSARREGLVLTAGFNARVDMDLKIGGLEESVTVTGASPIVDVATTQGGSTMSSAVFSSLPTGRGYTDVIRLTTGLTDTSPTASTPGMLGLGAIAAYSDYGNTTKYIMIDGLDFHATPPADFSVADQVDVRTYGNTAEIQYPGSVINLLLKSGGNAFHGRSQFNFINDKLQGTNLTDAYRAQGLLAPQALRRFTDFTADMGGRIVRDRLWFYGSYRDRNSRLALPGFVETEAPGSPAAIEPQTERTVTIKMLGQLTPKYQVQGLWQYQPQREGNVIIQGTLGALQNGNSRNTPAISTAQLHHDTYTYAPKLTGTPTNRLVFNVVGGYSGYHVIYYRQPECGFTPSSYDLTTTKYTGCSFGGAAVGFPRDATAQFWSTSGSLTYLAPRGKWGSHEVKTGWRQNRPWGGDGRLSAPGPNGEPDGGNYVQVFDTIGGVAHQPSQVITYNFPWHSDDRNNVTSVFVSDRWEATARLTFTLGARFDHFNFYVPQQTKPQGQFGISGVFPETLKFKGNSLVPRTAMAWDVTGDGKTVVKGSFGLFAPDPAPGTFNQNALVATTYRWHDLNRNGTYQPGEVDLSYTGVDFLSQVTPAGAVFNPDLKGPRASEIAASMERELVASTSIRALYLYHGYWNQNSTTNPLRPYSAFTVPVQLRDPGPDGITGNVDDGSIVTVWDYNAAFRGGAFQANEAVNRGSDRGDHYNSFDMSFIRRPNNRWGASTSVSVTKNHRWLAGATAGTTTAAPTNPNEDYFPLDETWNWNYKANATYRLPWDIFSGAIYDLRSGIYYGRTYVFRGLPQSGTSNVRLEKFGSQQLPNVHQLDLRAGKTLKFGTSTLELSVDALNVLNISAAFSATFASGPTYGNVTAYSTPITARLGAVFTF